MEWDLELEQVAEKIKAAKAKNVVVQVPDGLKPRAMQISKKLEKLSGAQIFLWFGSNFGACDIPVHIEKKGFDMVINYGHSAL